MDRGLTAEGADWVESARDYWDNPVHCLAPFSGREACTPQIAANGEVQDAEGLPIGAAAPCLQRLHIVFQDGGRGRVMRGDWEVALDAGDMALYVEEGSPDPTPARGNQVYMQFPLAALAAGQREVLLLLPVVLPGAHPATGLLARLASSVSDTLPDLSAAHAAVFLGNLLACLGGILASQGSAGGVDLPRLTRFHLHRIKAYLRQHLRQADMSVGEVARALGLSVSHVHRVFAHEGCSVSEWLWAERLQGAAAELGGPALAHRTVGEIALAWGFNDLSHFSRVFKKRFGLAPKAWRAQAPWRQPLLIS